MFKLPEKVKHEAKRYKESFEKFLAGELKDAFFKGIRVPWGNYSQRGGKFLMTRLRIPAGILTPPQLRAIGEAAQRFADGKLHITTRCDIQIHNVPWDNPVKILEYLQNFDLTPRGCGGNTIRGITCCYLSGVCPYEELEVYKMAWGITEYLLTLEDAYNLPRKFKIAFSGCGLDCAFAAVNDLGFVAEKTGFKVLVGGGMGAKSSVGKILHEKIEPQEVGYIVKAAINVFNKYGNRKNRHHNRLRFLIEDLGWEKFKDLYQQELKKVKEDEYLGLRTENALPLLPKIEGPLEIEKNEDPNFQAFLKYSVGQQKQKGYFFAKLRIPFGEITSYALVELAKLEESLPEIIFRTTPRQNIVITNVPYNKISWLYERLKGILSDFLYPETVLDVVSCKAATTCNLGICNAIALAPVVVDRLKKINMDLEKYSEVKININGCPNACGQHPIGTISFAGLAKKVHGHTVPFYRVYEGGKVAAENTRLAEELGMIPARAVPDLVQEYFKSEMKIPMRELIKKFAYVPSYEEDRSYYVDWGREEDFSLQGIGQGECGAGVIDMIESDLNSAKQSLAKALDKGLDLGEIKEALVYAARALLVVKGIDPKDEKEVISSFVEKFVREGIAHPDYQSLGRVYEDVLAGCIAKDQVFEYAQKFYEEVKNIYSLMDSSFNFQIRFAGKIREKEAVEGQTYDLRGTPCPINYVKAKIKLEGMAEGEVLNLYLDEGEPIANVPKSLESDGQEIVKIEKIENYYLVVVKKKV